MNGKIEVGETLTARSICDYDCIFTVEVLERNKSFVTVKSNVRGVKRVKVRTDDQGREFIFAHGTYSMSPVFRPLDEPLQAPKEEPNPKSRLEYLRGELRKERISCDELHELQSLAKHIEPGDVELLEAAGVPEHPDIYKCWNCEHQAEEQTFPDAKDIFQRIDPGDTFTDKECPKCGFLAYPVKENA